MQPGMTSHHPIYIVLTQRLAQMLLRLKVEAEFRWQTGASIAMLRMRRSLTPGTLCLSPGYEPPDRIAYRTALFYEYG